MNIGGEVTLEEQGDHPPHLSSLISFISLLLLNLASGLISSWGLSLCFSRISGVAFHQVGAGWKKRVVPSKRSTHGSRSGEHSCIAKT
jgi:hypothetical protein